MRKNYLDKLARRSKLAYQHLKNPPSSVPVVVSVKVSHDEIQRLSEGKAITVLPSQCHKPKNKVKAKRKKVDRPSLPTLYKWGY